MQIELVTLDAAPAVFELLTRCMEHMRAAGIDQWDRIYPNREVVAADARAGCLYVARDGGALCGTVALNEIQAAEYAGVAWRCMTGKALVIHRLAVDPACQARGVARALMDFSEDFARRKNYASIRLDAYTGNPRAIALYERRGYQRVGQVRFPRRENLFDCFEMVF